MFRYIRTCALLLGATLLLSACGGGGGGSDAPSTGDVAVVFTDGPTDQYERILVTMTGMTLIGSGGQVALYDGEPVTFDLLDMSEWGDLAFNTKVLAGNYSKIRLYISPDWTTVIKLDMDAKRSFQVVETGNDKLQFRPIVFVDVFQGDIFLPDRLVRVFGSVEPGSIEGDDTTDTDSDDSFRLCHLEFLSQVSGPVVGDPSACVIVYADGGPEPDDGPSLFDDTGAEVDFSAVTDGALLTAVGFLVETLDAEAVLGLDSVVVTLGDRRPDDAEGWATIQGLVTSVPASSATCLATDRCFDFDPDDAAPVVNMRR
jgi:hypothetical protein